MKVRSLVTSLEPKADPGEIIDLADEIANEWLSKQWGVRVVEPRVEMAVVSGASEQAVGLRQRRGK